MIYHIANFILIFELTYAIKKLFVYTIKNAAKHNQKSKTHMSESTLAIFSLF